MKKKELKKRIEDGFSELSPDLFEAVLEESRKQEAAWAEADSEKSSGNGKFYAGRFPRYALSLCASLAILCLCIFGVLGQKEKSVYMVLDINPSIQIEMNEEHQVKRLKGLNQDGRDVVKELKWKRLESVQELLDVLIQDVVEKSYLRENEGILVTLTAPDKGVCESLERALGEGIDRKLTELKVFGVTTAFQETTENSKKQGRKLLEEELTRSCGMDEKQVEQMSVGELIQYCQDHTSLELRLSAASEKERKAQQKNENSSQKPADSSQKDPAQDEKGTTSEKPGEDGKKPEGTGKKPDSGNHDPKDEKQDIEGNTDKDEIDNSVDAGNIAQTEGIVPSNASISIPSGTDGSETAGGGSGPMVGEGGDTGNMQKAESNGGISLGDHQVDPESGGSPDAGELPIQPGNGSSTEESGDWTQPGDAGGADAGDMQTNPKGDGGSMQTNPKDAGGTDAGDMPLPQDVYDLPRKMTDN